MADYVKMWMYILKNLPVEHAIQIWFITFHLKDKFFMDFLIFNMQYLSLHSIIDNTLINELQFCRGNKLLKNFSGFMFFSSYI